MKGAQVRGQTHRNFCCNVTYSMVLAQKVSAAYEIRGKAKEGRAETQLENAGSKTC